jgi:predicted NAD/FAD-binding protein
MPRQRRHWSVVNTRFDGAHSANTVWKRWKTGARPVFKSWVTYEDCLPQPLYALRTYAHPKVTRAYFEAQRALQAMQGQDQVWLAGMYTHDVDCHESAVLSAVRVAHRLAPGTARLRALTAPPPRPDPPQPVRRWPGVVRRRRR